MGKFTIFTQAIRTSSEGMDGAFKSRTQKFNARCNGKWKNKSVEFGLDWKFLSLALFLFQFANWKIAFQFNNFNNCQKEVVELVDQLFSLATKKGR